MRAVLAKSLSGRGLLTFAAAFVFALAIPPLTSTASAQDADGEVNDFSGGELSAQQKLDFAETAASELSTATARILSLIEEAQRQKDVLLLNCLNDKLINLRGLLKVAADSELNLAEAIARENQDQQEHNYRKVRDRRRPEQAHHRGGRGLRRGPGLQPVWRDRRERHRRGRERQRRRGLRQSHRLGNASSRFVTGQLGNEVVGAQDGLWTPGSTIRVEAVDHTLRMRQKGRLAPLWGLGCARLRDR